MKEPNFQVLSVFYRKQTLNSKMKNLVTATEKFVKNELSGAEGGHDWWHIYRVWQLAKRIASSETVDVTVVELGALLHDIADSKFHGGN